MNIDFGTAFNKPNGNAVKVTLNEFRDKMYLHIREYSMDGDTGQWYPTKSGFSLLADETSSLLPLLEEASKIGIYTPVDYANNPVTYCGMTIDNTPMDL